MEKLKAVHWKGVIYWFVVMALMNVYLIPTFINHQPITPQRIIVGMLISAVVALGMGLLTIPKNKKNS
ncbi:MAG: hypothetical protein RL427_321 [Bacteroidota bacterium]|jgi:hypothetical protein